MPFAIASFFARESKQDSLLGKSAFQQSQIEQYAAFAASSLRPAVHYIEGASFGTSAHIDKHHATRVRDQLYADLKTLDKALAGKTYLVGDCLTLADILVFCSLMSAFQLVLDTQIRKTMPHISKWFAHVASLAEVRKRAGAVKPCEVAVLKL